MSLDEKIGNTGGIMHHFRNRITNYLAASLIGLSALCGCDLGNNIDNNGDNKNQKVEEVDSYNENPCKESDKVFYVDSDGDGFGTDTSWVCQELPGYVENKADCDDNDSNTYPDAPELCDGKDNNCNGEIDENATRLCTTICGEGIETCVNQEWKDCTATQPVVETCNGIDDDCNGTIDDTTFGWIKIYGSDKKNRIRKINQTIDEGYVTIGETIDPEDTKFIWMTKLNKEGEIELEKEYDLIYDQGYSKSIMQTSDLGEIITASTYISYDVGIIELYNLIIKTNKEGEIEWEKQFYVLKKNSNEKWEENLFQIKEIFPDSEGFMLFINVYYNNVGSELCNEEGYNTKDKWFKKDIATIKLDKNGNTLWEKSYKELEISKINVLENIILSSTQTSDGSYILTGYQTLMNNYFKDECDDYNLDTYPLLIKIDKDGKLTWVKRYYNDPNIDYPGNTKLEYAHQTLDEGFILGGKNEDGYVIIKTNSSGEMEWDKMYSASAFEGIITVLQTPTKEYFILTSESNDTKGTDIVLVKLAENGDYLEKIKYGQYKYNEPMDMILTSNQEIVIVGKTYEKDKDNGLIIKLDQYGKMECE